MAQAMAQPSTGALDALPHEVLELIVRSASLNADLPSIRLVSPRISTIAIHASGVIIEDLRLHHDIEQRVIDIFMTHTNPVSTFTSTPSSNSSGPPSSPGSPGSPSSQKAPFSAVLRLSSTLHTIQPLIPNRMHWLQHKLSRHAPHPSYASLSLTNIPSGFLLLQTLSALLTHSYPACLRHSDILAPSYSPLLSSSAIVSLTPYALCPQLFEFISRLSMAEMDGLVTALTVVTTKLWSEVFLFKTGGGSVDVLKGICGMAGVWDVGVLAEVCAWRGPVWAARVLRRSQGGATKDGADCGRRTGGISEAEQRDMSTDMGGDAGGCGRWCAKEALWRGSLTEASRLAANGMARWLLKARERKLEEQDRKVEEERRRPEADVENAV